MQAFLGRNLRQQAALGKHQLSKYAINTVPVHGQEKYLLVNLGLKNICPIGPKKIFELKSLEQSY